MDGNEHERRAVPELSRPVHDSIPLHGSVVDWSGLGVLLLGASGAGKSSLALRLMALGADLVSDDRVLLRRCAEHLVAEAPQPLRGLVEARGVGILRVPYSEAARIVLAVDLDQAPGARMPEPRKIALLGCHIRLLCGRDVPNLDAIITVIVKNRAEMV